MVTTNSKEISNNLSLLRSNVIIRNRPLFEKNIELRLNMIK